MELASKYILSLTLAYTLTTVTLSALSENRLDLYISMYALEYFVFTLLHSPFNSRARKALDAIGFTLFAVFMLVVALKVLEILYGPLL